MKKLTMFILPLVIASLVFAQTGSLNLTYNHNALSVKDVNRSADFYNNVLQLTEIVNRTKIEGIRWFSLGEGKELHLVSVLKETVTLNKAVHFALNTQNIDAMVKRLTDFKVAYSEWPGTPNTITTRADGLKQLYFQDPDGYWIEINDAGAVDSVEQTQKEVWQMEELHWKYVKEQNLQAYLTLWDEKFIGYPTNNSIVGKNHITDWIVDMYKVNKGTYSYQLDKKAVNVFGDIVIVLFDITHIWTNEKNESIKKPVGKITHTWKKTDNGWVIIGGMGANK